MEPPKRVSERVNAGDRRIRESQSGKMSSKKHRRARFQMFRLINCGKKVGTQQSQCFSGERVLRWGLVLLLAAGLLLLLQSWTRLGGAAGVMPPVMLYVFAYALTAPNATALAMEPLPRMAGMAASLMGAIQMAGGSLAGWLVSLVYDGTPLAMGEGLALMAAGAFATYHLLVRRPRHAEAGRACPACALSTAASAR